MAYVSKVFLLKKIAEELPGAIDMLDKANLGWNCRPQIVRDQLRKWLAQYQAANTKVRRRPRPTE